jgi:phosphopantetheinyl transferase (holo-ACP synthase)
VVGNDIIDIKETQRSTNWERRGFIQKIFSIKEQNLIRASADPFTTVWRLWSMKESAYKVYIQAGGERFFGPTRIECSFNSSENGWVKIDNISLETETVINANYIFSSARVGTLEIDTCILQLSGVNGKEQSDFMQQQVLNDFAKSNSMPWVDLLLQKTRAGVPLLFYKDKPLNISLSITHHGGYGAYSMVKNEGLSDFTANNVGQLFF